MSDGEAVHTQAWFGTLATHLKLHEWEATDGNGAKGKEGFQLKVVSLTNVQDAQLNEIAVGGREGPRGWRRDDRHAEALVTVGVDAAVGSRDRRSDRRRRRGRGRRPASSEEDLMGVAGGLKRREHEEG
jgi:hypothetical protein